MAKPGGRRAQARLATIVVIATMPLWLLAGWAGGALGLPVSYAFLIDLVALAAFAWAIIVLLRVRSSARDDKD